MPIDFLARNAEIVKEYLDGATLQLCGETFHLSRQRVKQILKRAGVWRKHVILTGPESERSAFLGVDVSRETKDALKAEADQRGVSVSRLVSDTLDAKVAK